ncbi:SpoIIE family protein phosphatase [Dactylosporangium sp. AC04546]|uniref:ATP-binding protein n=1 Tax=Dactylosporangium sp. AC04546 TaxID=2862460 RepID=UPI001EDF747B|nr:ATP-binding protein [Dactylosporangium sp. AC04546]WVK78233.1 SpoIIE family protein phosphatase [Dactylosporangium sp. AC04546]
MSAPGAPPTVEELGWVTVGDAGAAGIARRLAVDAARRLGFTEQRAGEVAIVAAELASNLHRHADAGALSVRILRHDAIGGLELVAVDSGPGMADLPFASADGHSTAGTLGIGLGAVQRLSDTATGFSVPGRGTVYAVRLWPGPAGDHAGPPVAGLSRPIAGEQVCGDRYAARLHDGALLVLVADGLGHGPLASAAAAACADGFLRSGLDTPAAILDHLHRTVSHTRGAAVSVARVEGRDVRFAGLGNVSGTIAFPDGERRGLVTMPGIVGHQSRGVREFGYELPPGAVLVLHTDGVSDRWTLRDYPGLSRHDPLLVAATVLRDAGVRRDDACVAAVGSRP